jgi:tRNA pseudouridine38-40 synthase
MNIFRLTIAYDGTKYFGWQAQKKRPSVQTTLEEAVERVTGQRVRVLGSGRTDAGVHALGQVAALRVETRLAPDELQGALNAVLPPDVAVREACLAPEGFHPIRHALRKRYRYLIHNGPVRDVLLRPYCWHFNRGPLDAEAMHRAAQLLAGEHDFSSFQTSGSPRKSSVRTIFEIGVGREMRNAECGMRNADRGEGESRAVPGPGGGQNTEYEVLSTEYGKRNEDRAGEGRGGCGFFLPASPAGDWIVVEVEADGFLYNMVRSIVGTLVEVGRGAEAEDWIAEVLQSHDRRRAGRNAPPQGLFLVSVTYP